LTDPSKAGPRKIIRRTALRDLVPLSDSQTWRLEKLGKFPARIQLGPLAVGWYLDEIIAWIESRERIGGTQPPLPKNRRASK
jgi:prophage regulatory protein